jgi:hypothetical protein
MAESKRESRKVVLNNKAPSTAVSNTVELVVVNGELVPDKKDVEPGVNTATLKN